MTKRRLYSRIKKLKRLTDGARKRNVAQEIIKLERKQQQIFRYNPIWM